MSWHHNPKCQGLLRLDCKLREKEEMGCGFPSLWTRLIQLRKVALWPVHASFDQVSPPPSLTAIQDSQQRQCLDSTLFMLLIDLTGQLSGHMA